MLLCMVCANVRRYKSAAAGRFKTVKAPLRKVILIFASLAKGGEGLPKEPWRILCLFLSPTAGKIVGALL